MNQVKILVSYLQYLASLCFYFCGMFLLLIISCKVFPLGVSNF